MEKDTISGIAKLQASFNGDRGSEFGVYFIF